MTINSLRDAFLRLYSHRKDQQISREVVVRLEQMTGRTFVPFITRTQSTVDDEQVITLEAAQALQRWYCQ